MLRGQITQTDLISSKVRALRSHPLFRESQKSWAYYHLKAYDPAFNNNPNENPYAQWDETLKGPRPRVTPLGRIIVDSSAEFLMNLPPRITVPKNKALEDVLLTICEQNRMEGKWLPQARAVGNEGSCWIKFCWTPQIKSRPVAIAFYSPWEVEGYHDPLDGDVLRKVRVRIKYHDKEAEKWFLYQEIWTEAEYITFDPLECDEHDDLKMVGARFVNGEWPGRRSEANRFKLIPFVRIYNRREGKDMEGRGDLWDLYSHLDQISHTYWLFHNSNQQDMDAVKVIINADTAPNRVPPGSVAKITGQDADMKMLTAESGIREAAQASAFEFERFINDSVGADRLKPDEITNKGNLTRAVLELLFYNSVKTAQEKQTNWGCDGLALFFDKMIRGLRALGDEATRFFPGLNKSADESDGEDSTESRAPAFMDPDDPESGKDAHKVVIAWRPLFRVTPEERTTAIQDLAASVLNNFLSWERAVEKAADVWELDDVEQLKEELKAQKEQADARAQAEFGAALKELDRMDAETQNMKSRPSAGNSK